MSSIRGFLVDNAPASLALGGLLIGVFYGALAGRNNFCTMGAMSDLVTFGDGRRFRSWMLAVAVAVIGVEALAALGIVDLSRTMYAAPRLNWAGHILGGALFGVGMVLAGGCTSRNLVRAGAGDLRSVITLMAVGFFAAVANGGLLAPLRADLEALTALPLTTPSQRLADIAAVASTLPPALLEWAIAGSISLALVAYAYASPAFRASPSHWRTGLGVGLLVVAGWALTGLAFDDLADRVQQPASLSFVKPTADAIAWLERWTAATAMPGFAVASVFGVVLGAFLAAAASGRLKLATFASPADTLRHLAGAALMGLGGVMALGCSIGQGITGVSTLALGSLLAALSIACGAVLGLKALERWST